MVDADDDLPSTTSRITTPPPGLSQTSPPPTPLHSTDRALEPPATEGKDTRNLRHRVKALDTTDNSSMVGGVAAPGTGDDTEIADVAAEVSTSAELVGKEDEEQGEKDVEIADVAAEVAVSAKLVDQSGGEKVEVGGKEAQEKIEETKDVEIADVADEVANSAAKVDEEEEEGKGGVQEVSSYSAETVDSSPVRSEPIPAPPAKSTVRFCLQSFADRACERG